MQIRVATAADAAEIARVHIAAWQVAYRGLIPDTILDALNLHDRTTRWREILPQSNGITFVAETESGVAGFSNLIPARDPEAEPKVVGEIAAVYVHPNHWRTGIGRELCYQLFPEAKKRGFRKITLWVLKANLPAIKFYQSIGFTPDGAIKTEKLKDFQLEQIRLGMLF